jgi:hypothetical protein
LSSRSRIGQKATAGKSVNSKVTTPGRYDRNGRFFCFVFGFSFWLSHISAVINQKAAKIQDHKKAESFKKIAL